MDERTLRMLETRLLATERRAVHFRMGTVTDTTPLSVALGGAEEPYIDVASLAGGLAVNDVVFCLTFGPDVLVLGKNAA